MAGEMPPVPRLIVGALAVDDRGEVGFVNEFHFEGVRRFYTVANHRQGFVRAWHAHRREAKYVFAVQGAALVGAVQIDDWSSRRRRREPGASCFPTGSRPSSTSPRVTRTDSCSWPRIQS